MGLLFLKCNFILGCNQEFPFPRHETQYDDDSQLRNGKYKYLSAPIKHLVPQLEFEFGEVPVPLLKQNLDHEKRFEHNQFYFFSFTVCIIFHYSYKD